MAKIYAICNQKGGVGKTTTAINIAAFLASYGHPTLVVDLDPQGNATSALGISRDQVETSIYDVLIDGQLASAAIKKTSVNDLYILPATAALAGAEIELVSEMAREFKLRDVLWPIKDHYAYIIIDTPPSLSLLTINALSAADEVIVPIQCEYFALEGLSQMLKTIDLIKTNLHPPLKLGGIIMTMYDCRLILNNEVLEEVKEHFSDLVFNTAIPRNVRLSEAPSHGMAIFFYDPTSTGSIAYDNLTKEILSKDSKKNKNEQSQYIQQEGGASWQAPNTALAGA
jgi:chromosome partitioning protein